MERTDYDAMPDVEKALGKAMLDEQRFSRELAGLENEVATPLAERLRTVLGAVQGVHTAVLDDEQGVMLDRDGVRTSLAYPCESEVRSFLTKRVQLREALRRARSFLQHHKSIPES